MPHYGTRSQANLDTCHADIQRVFKRVIQFFDHAVLEGARSDARQEELFFAGKSKLRAGQSKHNVTPEEPESRAIDAAPWPIDWNDRERFTLFAGIVLGVAEMLGVKLRWGGDWDGDWQVRDNSFDDLPHFELED